MNENMKKAVFIKNSLNQSFIFYIDHEQNLIFNELDTNNHFINSTIIENNVLGFSASIDEYDKIHLVFLINNGDLIYSIHLNKIWHKNLIEKLNTKSNIYKHLALFLHGDYINIFYLFANLINTNLWTIEQITRTPNNLRKKTVTNIFSEKNISPFYIDKDSFGNISLIYSAKEYSSNHIYYTFYNIFTERWLPTPIKISSSTSNNILPYLFIDSQNNIHTLWYSLNNSEYLLTYKRFSSIGEDKYKWVQINLPKIISDNLPSIIFEEDNKLKILYITHNKIHCISSSKFSKNWALEASSPLLDSSNYLTKYFSSISPNNIVNKFNHCYINIRNEHIHFYLNNYLNKEILDNKEKGSLIQETKLEQTEVVLDSNSIEKNSLILEQIMEHLDNIKKDLILIKEKILAIEKTQNEKKKFLWFK